MTRLGAAAALAAALLLALLATGCGSRATARVPLIVDTDLSSDDLIALAYVAERPGVELEAVTVSGTGLVDCPIGARRAAEWLAALGHPTVPVACGRPLPLEDLHSVPSDWRRAADSLFGLELPPVRRTARPSAVSLLTGTVRRSPAKPTILELGPMTNLAAAFRRDPGLARRTGAVVAMGGALGVPGNAPGQPDAETNVWLDPAAARIVLRSGAPITLVPLDATDQVPVRPALGDALKRYHVGSAAGTLAWDLVSATGMARGGQYLWDPLAAAAALEPRLVRIATRRIAIAASGRTRVTPAGARVRVVTAVRRSAFERALLTALLGGRRFALASDQADLTLTYDGHGCVYGGERSIVTGTVTLASVNRSDEPFEWVAGRIGLGHSLADLRRYTASPTDELAPPPWFTVDGVGTTPPRSDMTWLVDLPTGVDGRTALACVAAAPVRVWLVANIAVFARR